MMLVLEKNCEILIAVVKPSFQKISSMTAQVCTTGEYTPYSQSCSIKRRVNDCERRARNSFRQCEFQCCFYQPRITPRFSSFLSGTTR